MTPSPTSSPPPPPNAPETTPASKQRVPLNCTQAFDSVYYCYSPVHQAREYYISGELDDCRGRLRRFRLCLLSRFRPQTASEQMYAQDELQHQSKNPPVPPVWEMRDEYVQRIRELEREEHIQREAERKKEAEAEVKWWL